MSSDHNHANAVDVHAHWYPREWLDLVRDHGPAHGVEWTEVPGKGPQFKVGHLATGPAGPQFVDLDARLAAMEAQGVAVHALSLSQPMVYWAGRDLGARLDERRVLVERRDDLDERRVPRPRRLGEHLLDR